MSMEKNAVQRAEAVLKAAFADKTLVSENIFGKNPDWTEKLEIAGQMVEQLCGRKKLMRYLLEKKYRQLKASGSENNKNEMIAIKVLKKVLNGGIAAIFICVKETNPGKTVYDCLIWNQTGMLIRAGTSENGIEGAVLNFLTNALGLDEIHTEEWPENLFFDYLTFLGLTLEGAGDSVCFLKLK